MIKDKSLSIFLMALFGISGTAILMLTWVWSTLASERILATFIGLVGFLVAVIQALMLKSPQVKPGDEQVLIKVEVKGQT